MVLPLVELPKVVQRSNGGHYAPVDKKINDDEEEGLGLETFDDEPQKGKKRDSKYTKNKLTIVFRSRMDHVRSEISCPCGWFQLLFFYASLYVCVYHAVFYTPTDGWYSTQFVPVFLPSNQTVSVFLPSYTVDKLEDDEESPQSKAWNWLGSLPVEEMGEEETLQEVFALATVYSALLPKEDTLPKLHTLPRLLDAHRICEALASTSEGMLECRALAEGEGEGSLESLLIRKLQTKATTIPPELELLTNLQELSLKHSVFSSNNQTLDRILPLPQMAHLSELQSLELVDCGLAGSLPFELGDLTSLTSLRLSRNALTGSIPSWLSELPRLENLDLSHNALTGTLPAQLLAQRLTHLSLEGNRLKAAEQPEGLLCSLAKKADCRWCAENCPTMGTNDSSSSANDTTASNQGGNRV